MKWSGKYKLLVETLCLFLLPLWGNIFNTNLNVYSSHEIISGAEDPVKVILIDPGHGGKDVGCHGSEVFEKDIALELALKVGAILKESIPSIEVRFTREKDVFIPLHERATMANAPDVDLFISIHCNALNNPNPNGIETYVMGLHTAEENLEVTKRENEVVKLEDLSGFQVDPYTSEGHILMATLQQTNLEKSILWADFTQKAFAKNTTLRNRGVKQAGFVVLRQVAVPSILIETGFLSNKNDETYLSNKEHQNNLAISIVEGIQHYIDYYREQ